MDCPVISMWWVVEWDVANAQGVLCICRPRWRAIDARTHRGDPTVKKKRRTMFQLTLCVCCTACVSPALYCAAALSRRRRGRIAALGGARAAGVHEPVGRRAFYRRRRRATASSVRLFCLRPLAPQPRNNARDLPGSDRLFQSIWFSCPLLQMKVFTDIGMFLLFSAPMSGREATTKPSYLHFTVSWSSLGDVWFPFQC